MRISYSSDADDKFQPSEERKQALVEAMRRYGARIYGYLCSMTGNPELAKDLAQDTWLKIYRYFEISEFTQIGLIYNRALQTFLDYKRSEKVRRVMGYLPDVSQISVASPRAEEGMPSEAFAWDEFWSNFPDEKFDPIDQKCFWLIYRYNYTIKEASERVGMPISTVADKVSRLMGKCRELLETEKP
jgi:RNA polymerase sigma factor (sigma-70 family)